MADPKRLTELTMPPSLADEVARQINAAATSESAIEAREAAEDSEAARDASVLAAEDAAFSRDQSAIASASASSDAQRAEAAATDALSAGDQVRKATWAELAAVTTEPDGRIGVSLATSGTHPSLAGDIGASGGQTPDGGQFRNTTGVGWVRLGDLESQVATAAAASAAASAIGAAATLSRTGVSNAPADTQIIGDTSPNGNNGLPVTTSYGIATPAPSDGQISRVSIKFAVASTGKLIIVDPIGRVISESGVLSFSAGSTAFVTLATALNIKKGQFVHYMRVTGQTPWAVNGSVGRQFDNATYTGAGNLVTVVATTNRIALAYELSTVGKTLATQIVGNTDALATFTDQAVTDQLQLSTPKYVANTTQISASFKSYTRRFDVGVTLSSSMWVDRITTAILTNASATQLYWRIIRRPLNSANINSYAPIAEDELVSSGYASFSSIGATAGKVWRGSIPVDRFQPVEGYAYFILLNALDTNGTTLAFGMGDGPTTDTGAGVGMRRGAYGTGNDANSGTYGVNQEIALTLGGFLPERASVFDARVEQATAYASDQTVVIKGQVARNGFLLPLSTTQTLDPLVNTATNTMWARYDVVYVNLDDMTYGVVKGTEGLYDASERIPALPTGNLQALFNCRVSFTGVEPVPVWAVFDGDHRDVAEQLAQERARFRRLIPKTRAKIWSNVGTLRFMTIGDSIGAIGDGNTSAVTGPGTSAPNGNRDRGRVYLSNSAAAYTPGGTGTANLSADIIESIPLLTAAQIGRTDTLGLGTVFTKFGWMWGGINAVEGLGLRTLGSSLIYDNFCIGGRKSSDLWNGAPTTWLTNAVNYCTANSVDCVVIHMAMNETAADTTRTNMVNIINAFKSVGVEVIVMGAWRPRQASIFANWDKVSREVRQAAYETNVAYHSRRSLLDDRYIGALGMSAVDVCSSNISNHPAIREQNADGLAFGKSLIG